MAQSMCQAAAVTYHAGFGVVYTVGRGCEHPKGVGGPTAKHNCHDICNSHNLPAASSLQMHSCIPCVQESPSY